MPQVTVTYISWSLGTGYTATSSTIPAGYGTTTPIYALSGSVVVTFNDVTASVTQTTNVVHTPTASFIYKIFKSGSTTNIYASSFDIQKTNALQTINGSTNLVNFSAGDKVYFELIRTQLEFSQSAGDLIQTYRTSYGSASLAGTNNLLAISSSSGNYITFIAANTICFTSSLVSLYTSSTYLPSSSTVLYNTYGDVYDNFTVSPQDIIVTSNTSDVRQYTVLSQSIDSSGSLCFSCEPSFSDETPSNVLYVLIVKRNENETRAFVNYKKAPGSTSYGFIIPSNIHPDVLANIDTITKQVKSKLN